MKIQTKEYSPQELVTLIVTLIKASDADLVDNRKCFPCKKEDHENYKRIRDIFVKIYSEADYSKSRLFQKDIAGKSESVKNMKIKLNNSPIKKSEYKNKLLESFKMITNFDKAYELANIDHEQLLNEVQKICHNIS